MNPLPTNRVDTAVQRADAPSVIANPASERSMNALRTILVPVDFSSCSAAAFRQSMRIAAWSRAAVTALHVVPEPAYPVYGEFIVPLDLTEIESLLKRSSDQWSNWGPAKEAGQAVTFKNTMGAPRAEILDRVRQDKPDLLVLGAHSDHDAKRRLGSVAAACVQKAQAKVLLVRQAQTERFRSVVACVDFSDTSRLALEQAIRIAAQDDAMLQVLHVYDDPFAIMEPPEGIQTHMPDIGVRYQRAVEEHLRAFCEPLSHEINALKATFHAEQVAKPGEGIVRFISRRGCDLAVLGTRAKWNIRDFLWGSTAERVVHDADCSVLTVKPAGFTQV